ncbi:hypothetical protein FO519_008722 [Halicephalobus sp. NKZ332]|nr:hypothetical protein FO519_008722 [Halicephalobus sp. NKZ332]
MTSSLYSVVIALFFCGLLTIGHAAPATDPHRNPSSPQGALHDDLVENNRYLMKMKKWFDSQAPVGSAFDDSWNRMHYFPNEKRMDEKFIVDDYPNLNPGRLEWNFNRL